MWEYLLTLVATAAVTYALTPLVRRLAIAVGARHAARDRDVHTEPMPLLGGLAMYGGLVAGLLLASQLGSLNGGALKGTHMALGLLAAGGLLVGIGFVDDRWGMSAFSKLAGQVVAGVIVVWSGTQISFLPEPGSRQIGLAGNEPMVLTVLVIVVTINAVNFIDGLDGLAAGVVGIGAIAFFAYYYSLSVKLGGDQTSPALVSAILAGVCVGFLPRNFHPAKIFMGDTGAMLIGLLLAYAPVSSLNTGAFPQENRFAAVAPLLVPAGILLVPYADLMLAVIRRTRAGMSPFAADRKHLQHRLLDIGHSHRASVLIMYLWTALFAGSISALSIVGVPSPYLAAITLAALAGLLMVSMPGLRRWRRPWARAGGGHSARRGPPGGASGGRLAASATGGYHPAPPPPPPPPPPASFGATAPDANGLAPAPAPDPSAPPLVPGGNGPASSRPLLPAVPPGENGPASVRPVVPGTPPGEAGGNGPASVRPAVPGTPPAEPGGNGPASAPPAAPPPATAGLFPSRTPRRDSGLRPAAAPGRAAVPPTVAEPPTVAPGRAAVPPTVAEPPALAPPAAAPPVAVWAPAEPLAREHEPPWPPAVPPGELPG